MPLWLMAAFWSIIASSGLLIGALIGWNITMPRRLVASIMAFGSGVLIAAVAADIMRKSVEHGGLAPASLGMIGGALLFTIANFALLRMGAVHRKRSGDQQRRAGFSDRSAMAIVLAAAMDGIPESVLLGTSMLHTGTVSVPLLIAFFLSNVPEGLSSSVGMRRAHRTARYNFSLWIGIMVCSGLAAAAGCAVGAQLSPSVIALMTAVAAGAILAMLVDTMIPEAFEGTHAWAGIITVLGFLTVYNISHW